MCDPDPAPAVHRGGSLSKAHSSALLAVMAILASACGVSSAGESAQRLLSSFGSSEGPPAGVSSSTDPNSAATAWRINDRGDGDGTSGEMSDSISADNGVTVRIERPNPPADPDSTDNPDGLAKTEPVDAVDRLVIFDAEANVAWTVAAGGSVATELGLLDFDGRYVLMARQPPDGQPDAEIQHIVYDLDCRAIDSVDCTDDFWARPGTAELTTTDRTVGDDHLNIQLLAICPTSGQRFTTPSELAPDQARAFQQATAALSTCDASALGDDSTTLRYDPANGDTGWRWNEYADALRGPYSYTGGILIWGPTPSGSTVQVTVAGRDDEGQPVVFTAGSEPSGTLTVTLGLEHLVLTGHADPETVERVGQAATQMALTNGLELIDRLSPTGSPTPQIELEQLLAAIANDLTRSTVGQIRLNGDGRVSRWLTVDTTPTEKELAAAAALTDLALGDRAAFWSLPLADHVYLAAGDRVVARRASAELRDRSGWRMDLTSLGDAPGPFNILNQAQGARNVTVGVLEGCDNTAPHPAPGPLAGLRRLSLQPDEQRLVSCGQWSSVDLYFGNDGRIHGVSLNLFGR